MDRQKACIFARGAHHRPAAALLQRLKLGLPSALRSEVQAVVVEVLHRTTYLLGLLFVVVHWLTRFLLF